MMELFDTHCHIHFPDYELDPQEVISAAQADGVTQLLCVGCTLPDSLAAIELAAHHDNIWATIGLHPHEGARYVHDHRALQQFRQLAQDHAQPPRLGEVQGDGEEQSESYGLYGKRVPEPATQQFAKSTNRVSGSARKQVGVARKVVAIGETGLDYYYSHAPKEDQRKLLRFQLAVATEHDLPLIFHVREAFTDFWQVLDDYPGVRGVVHSFTAGRAELEQVLKRGLFIGLNGIVTFTKSEEQLATAKMVPLDRLLLETDAPFLTPVPYRGKICQPKYVVEIAKFLAELRHESLGELAQATTRNARTLFKR